MDDLGLRQVKRATYPAYKPSGVEWLGDLPKHWKVRRLKYSASLVNQKVDAGDSDLPYTGLEHIESGTGKRIALNGEASSEGQANLYERGDVLFGKLRPYLAKVHAADTDGICTGELLVLRPREVHQKFLLDYLVNPDFIAIVDSSTYGAKMPRANWEFIGNLPALIPPETEQRAIAAFLDRETERIDSLIAKKQRQIELLQEKRAALISHAVTRGLDPDVKMKNSGIEWLGQIPEHWQLKRLKYLSNDANGLGIQIGPFGGMLKDVVYDDDGEFKVYGQENTLSGDFLRGNRWIAKAQFVEMRNYHIFPGDIVFTRKGSIGACSLVPSDVRKGIIDSDTIRLRVVQERVSSMFILYAFKYSDFLQGQVQETKRGAILSGLNTSTIANLLFPIPPLPEQVCIVSHVEQCIGQIDALMAKVEASIQMMREYRTALISAAVTGKIDVRTKQPEEDNL